MRGKKLLRLSNRDWLPSRKRKRDYKSSRFRRKRKSKGNIRLFSNKRNKSLRT